MAKVVLVHIVGAIVDVERLHHLSPNPGLDQRIPLHDPTMANSNHGEGERENGMRERGNPRSRRDLHVPWRRCRCRTRGSSTAPPLPCDSHSPKVDRVLLNLRSQSEERDWSKIRAGSGLVSGPVIFAYRVHLAWVESEITPTPLYFLFF